MTRTEFIKSKPAGSPAHDRAIQAALATAARAASHALDGARPQRRALLTILEAFAARVHDLRVETPSELDENITAIIKSFTTKYEAYRDMLDQQAGRAAIDLSHAFAELDRNAKFVTFMLFGRTKAGKSTTMEALTGGDGTSIGVGRQHTTTEIRAYYYPSLPDGSVPSEPSLRIVDTPGIEGFDGEALAELAEESIEQSDHVLFLFTDDKEGADELKRFRTIRAQGKSVTVLLNVKKGDQYLDVLVSTPELVFRRDEIDGHVRRISNFLAENLKMPPPRIIPIQARAAWLSKRTEDLPEGVHDRAALRKESRLSDLEDWIEHFILHEAVPARLRAPKDLLLGHLVRQKDAVRPVAGEFRKLTDDLEQMLRRLRDGTRRAGTRAAQRLPLMRGRFQAAADSVPGMVDQVIATGGRGVELDARWQALLREHGVTSGLKWFVESARLDFQNEIAANVQEAAFDHSFANIDGVGELLGSYYNAESGEQKRRFARAGIRTGGAAASGALATWAVANFWNPTGWAALAAAAVVGVAGIAGEELARKATNEWERSSRKELFEKRDAIIAKLRDRVWRDHRTVHDASREWLGAVMNSQALTIENVVGPARDASRKLWQAAVETLDELDEVAESLNESLVRDLFAAIVPECGQGRVRVAAVSREVGYRTKVAVSSTSVGIDPVAVCTGRQGSRIRRISEALGCERIDLVNTQADPETRVQQALGLRRDDAVVSVFFRGEGPKARLHLSPPMLARIVAGPRGMNKRLAGRLVGIEIELLEAE